MDTIPWTEESVFDEYNIHEEIFKTVSSHAIKTAILIPKSLKPGRHPVIYHLHGGFLVMAHGLFATFYGKWVHKLAIEKNAIVVSPDYRLLPSKNGVADLLEDVEDGWTWTKKELNKVLQEKAPGHEVDFGKTLLAGGSAGGYLAICLGLSHPDGFQALATTYPLIDPKEHIYNTGPTPSEPNVLRMPFEDMPSKEDTLTWIEESRKEPWTKAGLERTPYAVAACHQGIFVKLIFDNLRLAKREFYPYERIEAGEKLPKKLWLMHGDDDATVPIRGSDGFIKLVREKLPGTEVRYDVVKGEDHGFEYDWKKWESFSDEALEFVASGWLES